MTNNISEKTALVSQSLVIAELATAKISDFRKKLLNSCLVQLEDYKADNCTAHVCKELIEQTINFSYSNLTPEAKEELKTALNEYKEFFSKRREEIEKLKEEISTFKNA